MGMYIKLAWRNMLRNKRRSFIAGSAIGIGLAALIYVDALMLGMERNMIDSATSTFLGQGRIQRNGFQDTQQADLTINRLDQVLSGLKREPLLKHFTSRTLSFAMISSPSNLSSVQLVGVDPDSEKAISEIDEAITEGSYFSETNERDIIIGDKLAKTLKVVLGDRLVVTVSQAGTGDLSQDLFRVSGIFRLNVSEMDGGMAFVRLEKAQAMLGVGKEVHEIALVFTDPRSGGDPDLPFWKNYSRFGNQAEGWPSIMPQLKAAFELARFSTYLMGLILFGVVALGIINTLFMSLHERMFEFGVLRAVGTRPWGVIQLVSCEAGALAIVSIVMGCILGLAAVFILSRTGLDYTGIEYSGVTFRKLLFPVLRVRQFIEYPLWVFVFTILVGLYPASYAARIAPAAAMRRGL